MEVGCEAQLGVDDVLCGEVQDCLIGYALEVLLALHDGRRVGEGLKVEGERLLLTAPDEPVPEAGLVVGGQCDAVLRCKLEDRRDPESTIEVVMEFDLWNAPDHVSSKHV